MDIGVLMLFQNHPNLPMADYDMYKKELAVCEMAEPLGFDSIWAVEHHFTDYTLCPNPIEMLSYLAGKTEKVKLGTGAIIIPWHKDPLRVATDIAMLDNLCDRRLLLGIGRGIGRVEYDGFGVDMNDSRGIFEESSQMVLEPVPQCIKKLVANNATDYVIAADVKFQFKLTLNHKALNYYALSLIFGLVHFIVYITRFFFLFEL